MGWLGAIAGAIFGGRGGFLGSIIGSFAGSAIEDAIRKPNNGGNDTNEARGQSQDKTLVFCASAAAMLAKMAKADGVVTANEIAEVENAFERLGFDGRVRQYAVSVFRKAKDDRHTIYAYAREFTTIVRSVAVRELFYELLWDLACADGRVSEEELVILGNMPRFLNIRAEWFYYFRNMRMRYGSSGRPSAHTEDSLDEAYSVLGVSSKASNDEIKKAYRELAKKNHPDLLRAQGLPDELIGKATEKMSRINDAWTKVKEARGL